MSAPTQTKPMAAGGNDFSLKAILPPLMAIIVGMIMVILDSTVVNNAIPKLVEYFDTDLKTIQWTVTGYTLALSAVIPLAGWMTDKFGSKQIFMITIALFTIGSVLCGIAQTPEQLIIYRIIQGLGGGMMSPIGMAMVFKLAPPERRGSIMGILGIPMLMAPAFGPVLSGWLVDSVSWHWIFIINLPIGIIAFILGYKYLPKSDRHVGAASGRHRHVPRADRLLHAGLRCKRRRHQLVPASTITGLTVGGIALILFIFVELAQKQPLLELKVFKSSDFTRSIILTWIVQLALFGAMLIVPLYLQGVMHYTALETGWILMPQAICAGIGMPISGRLVRQDRRASARLRRSCRRIHFPVHLVRHIGGYFAVGYHPVHLHHGSRHGLLHDAAQHACPELCASPSGEPRYTADNSSPASRRLVRGRGLTGYLTSQITSHAASAGADANPLNAVVAGYGDTFFLSACIVTAGVALSLLLRKPKQQEEDRTAGGDNPDPAMMIGH